MKRFKMSKRSSKKYFRKSTDLTHKINFATRRRPGLFRGGIRL
jgi:hypothetical protein